MKTNNKFSVWGIIVCLLGSAGCATAPAQPDWAGKLWQEKQTVLVSGISSNCADMACAQKIAYANALSSLAEYMGLRLKTHTRVDLSSDEQSVNAVYEAYTQELEINNLKIEKFEAVRTKTGLTGYVLISVEQKELRAAVMRREQRERATEQEKLRKQQLGAFRVVAPKTWQDLARGVEKVLREQGYLVGRHGQTVRLSVAPLSCRWSQTVAIEICTLQASILVGNKKQTFSAKGYGQDLAQVRKETIEAWLRELPDNLME